VESIVDVILVSQVIIALEASVAIFIIGFLAYLYYRFIKKESKKKELIKKQKELETMLGKMSPDEREIWTDVQQRISNAEKFLGHPPTRMGQHDINEYSPRQLEEILSTYTRKQREKWSDWQLQIAKAEAVAKQESTEATFQIKFGQIHPELACPFCCEKGKVRLKSIQHEKGIVTSKVATAVIAGGVSLLTGARLSASEETQHAHCGNCGNSWDL
jgi:hypothetical protein